MITALRQQLASGTPAERVHAAWELGLLLGGEAAPTLRDRLDHEASVGARRHLVVVLAGLGEREAICAVAEHDPDARVRATAVTYVARVSASGLDMQRWLADRLSQDPTIEVALATLEQTPDAVAAPLAAALDALSRHDSIEVRERVVVRYERLGAPPTVVGSVLAETDPALRVRLAWLARTHSPDLLARLDTATVRAVARFAIEHRTSLRWRELAPFASRPELGFADAALVLRAITDHDEVPLSSLLALVMELWPSISQMEPIVSRCERDGLAAVDRARLAQWVDGLRSSGADHESDPADESYPPDPLQVAHVRTILASVNALLAR